MNIDNKITNDEQSSSPRKIVFPAIFQLDYPRQATPAIYKLDKPACPIYSLDTEDDEQLRRPTNTEGSSSEQKQMIRPGSIITGNEASTVPAGSKSSPTDDKQQPLSNYQVRPITVREAFDHSGNKLLSESRIDAEILINTGTSLTREQFSVPWQKLDSLASIISKCFPTAILYDKTRSSQVETEFRSKIASAKHVPIFLDHGWQRINDRMRYVHADALNIPGEIKTNLNLPFDRTLPAQDCYDIWRKSLNLYQGAGTMAALSMVSFMGISFRLFEEAGHPPRFTLFLVGKTGSFKTSLATVLYTQIENPEHRTRPRRLDSDSPTSIERGLVMSGRDNTTLIDDFSPGEGTKKNRLETSLESILRSAGDGSSRSRSNANLDDVRGEGVRGMAVVTGELRGKGLSSNLRCLYCSIRGDLVDTALLSWFQESNYYDTLLQHFIWYLGDHWNEVVVKIKGSFDHYRVQARKLLQTGRLADDLVFLWIMADILQDFFSIHCRINTDADIYQALKRDMISVVRDSERTAYNEDPLITYMRSLATMLETRELHIKGERLKEEDLGRYDGFEDDGFIYLLPTQPFSKIRNWISMGGGQLSYDEKGLLSALCRSDYAEQGRNGDGKNTLHVRLLVGKKRVNFIKIKKDAIAKFAVAEPDFY